MKGETSDSIKSSDNGVIVMRTDDDIIVVKAQKMV